MNRDNNNNPPWRGPRGRRGVGIHRALQQTVRANGVSEIRRSARIGKNNARKFYQKMKEVKEGVENNDSVAVNMDSFRISANSTLRYSFARWQYGANRVQSSMGLDSIRPYLATQLPNVLQESPIDIGSLDKVFAAQWLDNRQVVMGTKCNSILVYDVKEGRQTKIPSLKTPYGTTPSYVLSNWGSQRRARRNARINLAGPNGQQCSGVHAISINPSRTRLATSGHTAKDLAVYKLPSFDPAFLGEGGHTDWIFDAVWIDDYHCVSGARDGRLTVWCDRTLDGDPDGHYVQGIRIPQYDSRKPSTIQALGDAKIRSLAGNHTAAELGVLLLEGFVQIWDIASMTPKRVAPLQKKRENVCMSYDTLSGLYAVGSQSHVTMVDSRTLPEALIIPSPHPETSVRSVNFNEKVLSVGTGAGYIFFYDMTAGKYLENPTGDAAARLSASNGYQPAQPVYRQYFQELDFRNAIYTHCYDPSRTKLFTAGGPLPTCLRGNYASIWQ